MSVIKANIPEKMNKILEKLIKNGWFTNKDYILKEALQRYLSSHQEKVMEKQILEDVKWGLAK